VILLDTSVVSAVMLRRPDPAVVPELRYGVGPSPIKHRNDSGAHCIAMAHEAQLATRNVGHFSDTSICLINPFATDPHSG